MAERGRGSRRVVGRHLLLPWAAPSRAAESLRRSALSHTSAPTRREVPAGVMSRRWLSTRGVSGFARRGGARRRAGGRAGGRAPRAAAAASRRLARRRRAASRVAPPARGWVLRWLQPGPLERHARRAREQPPVGGHRGGGQARDGVDPVPLLSLVGWVCSSSAQKEAKNSTATLSVSFLDAPCSTSLKSWLVVARSASAPLRLVGHLGWVHRQEARAVGQPRERMGGRR